MSIDFHSTIACMTSRQLEDFYVALNAVSKKDKVKNLSLDAYIEEMVDLIYTGSRTDAEWATSKIENSFQEDVNKDVPKIVEDILKNIPHIDIKPK